MKTSMITLLCTLSACGWRAPLDPGAAAVANGIQGEVVLATGAPAAPTYVLLYDAADPPPPAGTGAPLNFAAVPAEAFTGPAGGVQSAPYVLTGVPDGVYLVQALVDVDGDFHPLAVATKGATCGDLVGAHVAVDAEGSPSVHPIAVQGGELLDDVTVIVSLGLSLERPAFALLGGEGGAPPSISRAGGLFQLESTAVRSPLIDLGPRWDPAQPELCAVAFPTLLVPAAAAAAARMADTGAPDGDSGAPGADTGAPSPAPTVDPLASWPKVYLELVAPDAGPLAEGERWQSQAGLVAQPLIDGGLLTFGATVPTLLTGLPYGFGGAAQRTAPDGTVELITDPEAIPAGMWAVTVVSLSGQTWTVPNETAKLPSLGEDFVAAAQGGLLRID